MSDLERLLGELTPEQQRLTWVYYNNFVRAGAKLDATATRIVG